MPVDFYDLTPDQRAGVSVPATDPMSYWDALLDAGRVELLHEPPVGASLGYAAPVVEVRGGRTVAVAYALGSPAERAAEGLRQAREGWVISPFQARAALAQAGLLDAVDALMADQRTDALARLAWLYAQEFRRSSPTIAAMAQAFGLSEEQLDALFVAGAQVVA